MPVRHAGHADDVTAVALEAVDLGCGLQARALRARIHATIHRAVAGREGRREQAAAQGLVVGLGEVDVAHRRAAALEEGAVAPPGVVDDLARHDQRARREVSADAAHRGDRDDAGGLGLLERPDVRAVIDQVRRNRVAVSMTGEEDDRLVADAAEGERTGGLAVGRAHDLAALDLHVRQLGESAAADDREHGVETSVG